MIRHRSITTLCALLGAGLLMLCGLPVSQAAAVDGLAWLQSAQNADGSFGATPTSLAAPLPSTAEALRAYQILVGATQPGFAAALTALNANTEHNTEYLARQVVVNAALGADVTSWVSELLTHQNTDGGSGEGLGGGSAVLDTAYALEALAAAGQGATPAVGAAVNYLLGRQTANGGWAEGDNAVSVPLSALTMRALWSYRYAFDDVPVALSRAQNYLLASRDTTGAWGEHYASALAAIALIPYLPDIAPIAASLEVLRAGQSANGSWGEDSYTTALALRALALADRPQTNPDYIVIKGRVIDALTGSTLSGVSVSLAGTASGSFVTASDGLFKFINLPAGSYTVTLSLTGYGTLATATSGQHGQTIDLRTLDMVKATGSTTGTIRGVVSDDANGQPLAGVAIGVTGIAAATLTDVQGSYQINNVPAGTKTLTASLPGYDTVSASATVTNGGVLVFSPSLEAGIAADTRLFGHVTDAASGAPLAGVIINVTGGATASAATDAQGDYRIDGLPVRAVTLAATLAGYDAVSAGANIVADSAVQFSPRLYAAGTSPADANTAAITGVVLDAGSALPLPGAAINATFGTLSRKLIADADGRFSLSGISVARGTLSVALSGYVTASLAIAVEPLRSIDIGAVRLRKNSAPVLLPDLTVTGVNSAAAPVDPATLLMSGTLVATVSNAGTRTAPAGVAVRAYYDANRNGDLDAGEAVLGEAATGVELLAGSGVSVSIPVNGGLPFRDAPVTVWVDAAQAIVELDETNNIGLSSGRCIMPSSVPITVPAGYYAELFAAKVTNQQGPVEQAFDSQGNLYIAPGSGSTIVKIPAGTNMPEPFGSGFSDPDGVAVDSHDNVIVADKLVKKYAPDGTLIWARTCPVSNTQLAAVDAADTIYIGSLDSVLCKIPADGSSVTLIGNIAEPTDPVVGPDGLLYVGLSAGGTIAKLDLNGTYLGNVAAGVGYAQLVFDAQGRLLVPNNKTINVLTPPAYSASSFASGFNGARSLAFDPRGDLYVGDLVTKDLYRIAVADRPDLTVALLSLVDRGTGQAFGLTLRVGNGGTAASPAGVQAAVYQGDPDSGGSLLGTATLPGVAAGDHIDIQMDIAQLSGSADLYALVDGANAVHNECERANNRMISPLTAVAARGAVTAAVAQPVYAPNDVALITAQVTNTGALPASYSVQLRVQDGSGGWVADLPARTVGPLLGGASAGPLMFDWHVGGVLAGDYRARVVLRDAGGRVVSEAEAGFQVRHPDSAGSPLSLKVATDRTVYYLYDQINIESLVANTTLSTLFGQLSLRLTISDAAGAVLYTVNSPVEALLPGSARVLNAPYALSGAAVSVYTVRAELLDAGPTVRASAQTQFEVRYDPLRALVGQAHAGTPSVEAGASQACDFTVTNQAPVAASVELHRAVVDLDRQLIASDQVVNPVLAAGAVDTASRSIATGGLAAGNYACAVLVRSGSDLKTLAFAPFIVTQPPIVLSAELVLGHRGRLLVLVDPPRGCRPHDDHDKSKDANSSGTSQDDAPQADNCQADPHGPKTAPGLDEQRALLESLLKQAGWSYAIADSAEVFARELHSGNYGSYALFAEHEQPDERVQQELREAVFRGEGLLIAGAHDGRYHELDPVMGIRHIGHVADATGVELAADNTGSLRRIDMLAGDRPLRIKRLSAQSLGVYRLGATHGGANACHDEHDDTGRAKSDQAYDDACNGHPERYLDAITRNSYGQGQALYAGLDLLATAAQAGPDSVAALTLGELLAAGAPVPGASAPAGVTPLDLHVVNQGMATPVRVSLTLPAGVSVVDPGTASAGNDSLYWDLNLAINDSQTLPAWLRLPPTPGVYNVQALIEAPVAGSYQAFGNAALALTVEAPQDIDSLLAVIDVLIDAQVEPKTLNKARAEIVKARGQLLAKPVEAIKHALAAADDLAAIDSADVFPLRLAVAAWVREIAMRLP